MNTALEVGFGLLAGLAIVVGVLHVAAWPRLRRDRSRLPSPSGANHDAGHGSSTDAGD